MRFGMTFFSMVVVREGKRSKTNIAYRRYLLMALDAVEFPHLFIIESVGRIISCM